MHELDLDDLTAEIFKRVLRMRSTLDEDEFDDLAGELMISMGSAAMRKAEDQAFRRQAMRRSDRSGTVVAFPKQGQQTRDGASSENR
ncbi:hypothetical protein [Methylobacterium sp. 88A]|uniref:hypothetical protein n=1 Tax=Methylobacterium sp. 88A TaxID=1131813 RepID=UPI000381266D|nr:hypothetical protein [Methylobacterium sp. 88A]